MMELRMELGNIRANNGKTYNCHNETDMMILCKEVNDQLRIEHKRTRALENVINNIASIIKVVKKDE